MRRTRNTQRPARRRAGVISITMALVAGLLMTVPTLASAKDPKTYTIVFEHTDGTTTTVSGVADKNDTFIADAGGDDKDNPTGIVMHLSCSDKFTDGWGDKKGPDRTDDPEWRVQSFFIEKGKKTCGTPTPPPQPDIDIEKATNGHDADHPTGPEIPEGDRVTWTYVVTNTGDTPLTDVRVIDYVPTVGSSDSTEIDCPKDELAIGEVMTCEAYGTAEVGQYANEAKVTALGPAGAPIAIDGNKKQYTFVFEHTDGTTTRIDGSSGKNEAFLPNAGGKDKNNPTGMTVHVSCSDKFPGGWGKKDGPNSNRDSEWQIKDFWIREVKDGKLKKQCGSPLPITQMVMDQDPSHYFGIEEHDYGHQPAVDIEKATNGHDADDPTGPRIDVGDRVTWTYEVTNTGQQTLYGVFVYDEEEGRVDCPERTLRRGDSMTCTLHGRAHAGQYANEAWVTAWGDSGMVTDSDWSHYYGVDDYKNEHEDEASIDLEKATNGHDADTPRGPEIPVGDTVTWTYEITNTGDTTLYAVYLYDEEEGRVHCPESKLRAGDSMTCTLTGHARHGQYANEAWVTAWTDSEMVTDTDWSHYFGVGERYGKDA